MQPFCQLGRQRLVHGRSAAGGDNFVPLLQQAPDGCQANATGSARYQSQTLFFSHLS